MKAIRLVCILAVSFYYPNTSVGSHGMGGEVTWSCQGNGQYIFQLKFYRDCNGIAAPSSISLVTNHPIGGIPMPKVATNDISPDGYMPDGSTACPECQNGNSGNPIQGLIEEHIYESSPITLSGVPPSTGWVFSWGSCCRSALTSNLQGAGSLGFKIKAVMYPFQSQNTDPCFDSSPSFAEKPSVIMCTDILMQYQHLTFDKDMDSVVYSFSDPLDDSALNGTPIPFSPGYSTNNPLPGPISLNTETGQMTYTPTSGGYYALVIKAASYKCGVIVSEVFREILVVVNNNCPQILDSAFNTSANATPAMDAPFQDPVTGQYTSYKDTVLVGDSISFTTNFADLDLFLDSTAQIISMNSFSTQYGNGFIDPTSGCLLPPCATLSNPPPFQVTGAGSVQFNWQTTPIHLGLGYGCVNFSNTHYFIFKAADNYCPANAVESQVVSITVMPNTPKPPVINNGGVLECLLTGSYNYYWFRDRWVIPGANSVNYTPTQTGSYQVLAVDPTGDGNYSDAVVVNVLGMDENSILDRISISPNPSYNGVYNINIDDRPERDLVLQVSDNVGNILFEESWVSGDFGLDLSRFAGGIYFLTIHDNQSRSEVFKLVRL